jgi:hypothetical protein
VKPPSQWRALTSTLFCVFPGWHPTSPRPFSALGLDLQRDLLDLREQLTLELAILSEQKTAKVIQLLEESRRDNPLIRNRVDQEAEAMAQPADPRSVLDAIKEIHDEAEQKRLRRHPLGAS